MSRTVVSCTILRRTGRIAVITRVCLVFSFFRWPEMIWLTLVGTGWNNTEYRSFVFSDETHTDDLEGYPLHGDNATMVETEESRHRRGKDGPMLDRERQKTLYKLGTQGWDDQGLQLSTAEREKTTVPEGKEVEGVRV